MVNALIILPAYELWNWLHIFMKKLYEIRYYSSQCGYDLAHAPVGKVF